jgi:cell division protein FtsL
MSRHAAATTAGRRTIPRSPSPAAPRRVSGPATPNRRDAERPLEEPVGGGPPRAPRTGAPRSLRAPRSDRAPRTAAPRTAAPRADRGPRAGSFNPTALAYAGAAVAPRARLRPAPRTFAAPRPQRLAYGGVAIASRMAGVALDVSGSRAMDRLVRSRVWIGIIAFGLIGLVATQVSLLKLNSGIGRAVQTASTLERSNSTLRAEISTLSAGDRIQRLAEAQGMVMPEPSDIGYLRAGGAHSEAVRAVARMRAPDPSVPAGFAGAATQALAPATTTAPGPTAPATAVPAGTAPATTTAPATAPVTATTQPASSAPATTAPPAPQPNAATATAAPTGAASGGASPQQATTTTP